MYDPSIGQESLTAIDIAGVLIGHFLFGVAATFFLDWTWIPLSQQQKNSGRSLEDIKKEMGWNKKGITENKNHKN